MYICWMQNDATLTYYVTDIIFNVEYSGIMYCFRVLACTRVYSRVLLWSYHDIALDVCVRCPYLTNTWSDTPRAPTVTLSVSTVTTGSRLTDFYISTSNYTSRRTWLPSTLYSLCRGKQRHHFHPHTYELLFDAILREENNFFIF